MEKSSHCFSIILSLLQQYFTSLFCNHNLLLTDLCIGFHLPPHGWELIIGSVYKDCGFAHNDQIISGLVSTFSIILDTNLNYWIFWYLNCVSTPLVVIYHSIHLLIP